MMLFLPGMRLQVRNLGAPVDLAGRYFREGADEVTFLNITGFRDFPLGDLPMLEVQQLLTGQSQRSGLSHQQRTAGPAPQ